jgi:hypothetical protein
MAVIDAKRAAPTDDGDEPTNVTPIKPERRKKP